MGAGREELQRRVRSFGYALDGWRYALRTQRNTWIHALFSVAALALAWWLSLPRRDWAVLILTITLVWVAEFINTAVEAAVDMAMPETHPLAKVAKDVSAAAVLVGACGAVLVGLLLLGPPLWVRLAG